jgi:hypothetical protein
MGIGENKTHLARTAYSASIKTTKPSTAVLTNNSHCRKHCLTGSHNEYQTPKQRVLASSMMMNT